MPHCLAHLARIVWLIIRRNWLNVKFAYIEECSGLADYTTSVIHVPGTKAMDWLVGIILYLGAYSRFAVVKSQVLPGIQRVYIRTPLHDLVFAGSSPAGREHQRKS
jgi:hypothetical protein